MSGKRSSSAIVICAAVALLASVLLSVRGVEALEICNMDDRQLTACLPQIHGRPFTPVPSSSCCAALRNADLSCLCRYKGAVVLRSIGIDPKLAAALPTKCQIQSPPDCTNVH